MISQTRKIMALMTGGFIRKAAAIALAVSALYWPMGCASIKKHTPLPAAQRAAAEGPLEEFDLDRNIGHITLDIGKKYFDITGSCYSSLDDIIETARQKIDKTKEPEEILGTIYSILKNDHGYANEKTVLFSDAVCGNDPGTRIKDCDTGSLIYLSIGEELGLPLKAVKAPDHVFIRWVVEGGEDINWETLDGEAVSDEFYIKDKRIPDKSIQNGVFMKNLTRRETLALAFFNNGFTLDSMGRYEEAIDEYSRAIDIYPNYAKAFNHRGISSDKSGRHEEAIKDYDKAIDLHPDYTTAFSNRGISLNRLGRNEEAIKDYDQAIRLDPSVPEFFNNRGVVLAESGKCREAIQNFNRAIELKPDYSGAFSSKGECLAMMGMHERAVENYNRAIKNEPGYARVFNNKGMSLVELGKQEEKADNHDKAMNLYKEAIGSYNKAIGFYTEYEEALSKKDDSYDELARYEQGLKIYYADVFNNKGIALARSGKCKKAIEDYDKAIELNPYHKKAFSSRKECLDHMEKDRQD